MGIYDEITETQDEVFKEYVKMAALCPETTLLRLRFSVMEFIKMQDTTWNGDITFDDWLSILKDAEARMCIVSPEQFAKITREKQIAHYEIALKKLKEAEE